MFLLNFITSILFIYLLIYSIYLLTLNIKSFGAQKFFEEDENLDNNEEKKNFCVIVWTNEKDKNPNRIIYSLNAQDYPKEFYNIHMVNVYDDENHKRLNPVGGNIQIHQIDNPEFFSKDKAISLLVEKVLSNKETTFDGFIFLDSNRYISKNFITEINNNFVNDVILTDKLSIVKNKSSFFENLASDVLYSKLKYTNNTLNNSRTMFSLVSVIDGGACVIPSNILEKTGRVCFETRNDELKYTLFLASNQIKTIYCPYLQTGIEADDYDMSSPKLSQKIMLLKYYFPLLFKKPWYFIELVLSILKPNAVFATVAYLTVLYISFKYMLELKYTINLGVFLLINVIVGFVSSKLNIRELLVLPLYPIYASIIKYKLIAKNLTKRSIANQNLEEQNINSATIKSCVGNEKKNMPCKLDLVSEDGMRKVVFRYGRKSLFSDSFLRMHDALNDIIMRLKDKGFMLKVCQNCEYFKSQPDGTMDLLKGTCSLQRNQNGDEMEVLIWNGCTNFVERKNSNIINPENLGK